MTHINPNQYFRTIISHGTSSAFSPSGIDYSRANVTPPVFSQPPYFNAPTATGTYTIDLTAPDPSVNVLTNQTISIGGQLEGAMIGDVVFGLTSPTPTVTEVNNLMTGLGLTTTGDSIDIKFYVNNDGSTLTTDISGFVNYTSSTAGVTYVTSPFPTFSGLKGLITITVTAVAVSLTAPKIKIKAH